ncbi:MAG: hypothetical protein BWY31_02564 [Lentisphaerae bacterium ADurb.Bin242]|nr:MAG: hypothetical protein BWY31_02564 [Lentisphaerae bacterium ADurb.Bin242]
MKLSLAIMVYNGGDYWRECWESVKANLEFFDGVYISFNKSPRQAEDMALVKECPSEKIHWISHDCTLSALQHGRRLDRWIGDLKLEGHVFSLCHDDILLREGLEELSRLDLREGDAVFGPFHFFTQDGNLREMTVREFHRQDGEPLSRSFFASLQDQWSFTYNVSGMTIPASIYRKQFHPWGFLRYGCRSECCHLCNPYIHRIFQPYFPTVKIRWHGESEGSRISVRSIQYDTLVYLMISFASCSDSYLRTMNVRSMGYIIRQAPLRGLYYFFLVQYKLRRMECFYPEAFKVYRYLFLLLFRKAKNLFKRILRIR